MHDVLQRTSVNVHDAAPSDHVAGVGETTNMDMSCSAGLPEEWYSASIKATIRRGEIKVGEVFPEYLSQWYTRVARTG